MARLNLNLLVFNPLWWFLAVWKRRASVPASVLLLLSLLAHVDDFAAAAGSTTSMCWRLSCH